MATRIRFADGLGTPGITPAAASGWEDSSLMRRYQGITSGTTDTSNDTPATAGSGSANDDTACFQLVYGPIAAQTISGTIKGQMAPREAAAGTDARAQLVARVIASDGSTVRGTLYNFDTAALSSEFNISASARINRQFPRGGAQAVSSVDAQAGDYVVVEFGFRNHGTNTSAVRMGAGSGSTDLPEDETTAAETASSAYRPWVEFSATIAPLTEADATAATGTGAANTAKASIKPTATAATGTGAANDATVSNVAPPRTVTINGTDYTSLIQMDGFAFTECANRGEVGTGGFDVLDEASSLDIPALKAVVFDEPAAGPSNKRAFTGFTHERTAGALRDQALAAREWAVEAVDLNVLASDFVLTEAESADRGSETDYARVVWLLTTALNTTGSVGSGVVPNSNTVTMEATDYRGRKPADVLAECSEAAGKLWFIYDYGAGRKLYYDVATGTSLSSTALISDLPQDMQQATLDALDAVGSWTNGGNASSTLSAVATNPDGYSGTSLQMAVAAEASMDYLGLLDVALDLSAHDDDTPIRLHVRASSLTNLTNLYLYFGFGGDIDTNYAGDVITPSGAGAFEEFTFTRSALSSYGGSVDWSDVTQIGFYIVPSGSYTGDVIVRDLRMGGFDGIFAPQDVQVKRSPDRIYSKVHLTYNGGTVTVSDSAVATAYRAREAHVLDSAINDSTLATAKAQALLDGAAAEIVEVNGLTIVVPKANLNDIRAGQRVQIKLTRFDIDSFTYFRVVKRTVQPLGVDYYLVALGLASDVLASANGSRGGDDIWPNKSNANDDGATVIVDRGGITVTDGAITVTNAGATVIIDGSSDMFRIAAESTQSVTVGSDAAGSASTTLTGLGALDATPASLLIHSNTDTTAGLQAPSWLATTLGRSFVAATSGGSPTVRVVVVENLAYGYVNLNGSDQAVVNLLVQNATASSITRYQKYFVLDQVAF